MRISRWSPIAPLLLMILAGCTGSPSHGVDEKEESEIFVPGDEQSESLAGELALQYIAERPDLFQGAGDLTTRLVLIDDLGQAHARVRQNIRGIPVFGGEAIIHLSPDGLIDSVTDDLIRGINLDVTPALSEREAVDRAIAEMGGERGLMRQPEADLQILRHEGMDHLTFRVRLDMVSVDDEPTMPVVFVDAHDGEVVWSYDNLETAKNRKTYTAKNGLLLPGTLTRSEGQGAVSDSVLNQAHDNAGITYDYYFTQHGRDSYNGTGATITSSVHYRNNYVNAFWNGTQMVYGDGDGVQSSPLVVVDVVGHELTHAVTTSSSNLTYSNESGALNEAMSDIFAAAIEVYRDGAVSGNTWKVGEECWTPSTGGDALRYMNNPTQDGSSKDYYPERYTGLSDNGGVHTNSGIANLAFYLMVAGGTHPRGKTSTVVPALDANALTSIQKGAAIFYRANTTCLTASSNFASARSCTQQAASTLYGSNASNSVSLAWTAVGVP